MAFVLTNFSKQYIAAVLYFTVDSSNMILYYTAAKILILVVLHLYIQRPVSHTLPLESAFLFVLIFDTNTKKNIHRAVPKCFKYAFSGAFATTSP